MLRLAPWVLATTVLAGCTFHHSRQALDPSSTRPSDEATFVSEEDSGLGLLGLGPGAALLLSEPDHYAVLLERMRRHYRCGRIHHAQLDFYTDNWLLVTFPIARVTAICEPLAAATPTAPQTDATSATAPEAAPATAPETTPETTPHAASEVASEPAVPEAPTEAPAEPDSAATLPTPPQP